MPASIINLQSFRQKSDPIADKVILDIIKASNIEGINNLFVQLRSNSDVNNLNLPECVKHYFNTTNNLPDWFDNDKVLAGQRVFSKHGPQISLSLLCKSLPEAYACANGAKVLYTTGRMTERNGSLEVFTRRLMETSQFVVNVCIPGGLEPKGKGIITAQKVRLIHAAIRYYIKLHKWDAEELGEPINQQDMAGTLQSFSTLIIEGLETMNIDLAEDEKEGYYHCWRVVGHIMGLEEELNPPTYQEGYALGKQILKDQIAPSMEGKVLTQAVCDFMTSILPGKIFEDLPEAVMKFLVGEEIAKVLDIHDEKKLRDIILPKLLGVIFNTVDDIQDSSKLMLKIIEYINMHLLQGMLNHFSDNRPIKFDIPPNLRNDWKLN